MKQSRFLLLLILSLLSLKSYTQNDRSGALKIFLDGDFDKTYIKENFTVVNYVRDRLLADVHIQLTTMRTASGGRKFTMEFIGQNQYKAWQDTIIFFLESNFSKDEKRLLVYQKLKLGLVPYLLKTPYASKLTLNIEGQNNNEETKTDAWNHWVFNIYAGGFSSGAKSYNQLNTWSGFSVSRVTEKLKIENSVNGNFMQNIYRSYDGDSLIYSDTTQNYGYGLYNLTTKSIGNHWGIGGFMKIKQSSYNNLKLQISITPAIEYNVFPYSEASKKQLRFLYFIGPKWNTYFDTTVFLKTQELVYEQTLQAHYKHITKWGQFNLSAFYSNYFQDFSLLDFGFDIGTQVRLVKGLSLGIDGKVSFPRDQITLRKGSTSSVDLYTRQRELQTDYSYFVNIRLSYTFGSIYNNVVNPRFDRNF
jgi:hypothetical protein